MQPNEIEPGSPEDWLRHATSDLELSRTTLTPGMLLEGLCYHTQQAAEKALKAVLIFKKTSFPRTHNIRTLLDLLPKDLDTPESLEDAAILTDYAVFSRYPGYVEPVQQEEYEGAVRLAEAVVSWAEKTIQP